jgi:16S rRNA (adenine1518-N6/adenine1519-N6)-dimethyltransferase
MVQAEVADRILASPPEMSILSVSVQFYCRPRRIADVPAAAFYPVPKVDSAVIRLDAHAEPPVALPAGGEAAFFRVVRAGFGQRRKQLKNSLAAGLTIERDAAAAALARCGIDPRRRAETLSLAEWSELAKALGMQAIAGRHDRSPGAPDDPAARRSR